MSNELAERLERLREIAYRDEAKRVTVATDDLQALVEYAAQALREAGRPGWALVPREPTPKMVDATWNDAAESANGGGPESHNTRNRRVYAAMLAAAPTPDQEPTQ